MDFADLKNKSNKELDEMLLEKRSELMKLGFKVGEKQLKNIKSVKKARRIIAKILTLLNNRRKQAATKSN